MDKKGIAVLTMLALIGVGMAFAFVGLVVSGTGTSHEDVWTYQKPVKLVEEVSEDAVEICAGEGSK